MCIKKGVEKLDKFLDKVVGVPTLWAKVKNLVNTEIAKKATKVIAAVSEETGEAEELEGNIAVLTAEGDIANSGVPAGNFVTVDAFNALAGASNGLPMLDGNKKLRAEMASSLIVECVASKTLSLFDDGKFELCKATTAITITIPSAETVAFPEGAEIEFANKGGAQVTIAADTNVSLNGVLGGTATMAAEEWNTCGIKKLPSYGGEDAWIISGGIEV